MAKEIEFKSRLDADNIPEPKKPKIESKKQKLGLLSKKKIGRPISFRMRPEVVDILDKLTLSINKYSRVRFSKVAVLELCIMHSADKRVEELLDFYTNKII